MSTDNAIAKLDQARAALAECKTVMEAKQIADVAEAARVYLERTNASAETVNRATEIRLLAERQMGAFLKQMPKNEGAMGKRTALYVSKTQTDLSGLKDGSPTIKEMGVSYGDAHRARKLADIPEPEFRERIEEAKAEGKLTTAAVIRRGGRVRTTFDMGTWQRQARSVMTSWLQSVPEDEREKAASFLSSLPNKIITQIQ